ncbi:MAG: cytidine deaminase [candidate division SR1 bacterium]|nr:cytidine deaminase [candidate division SR1 bacterium]
MDSIDKKLIEIAKNATKKCTKVGSGATGLVGCALITDKGNIFEGVCLAFDCQLGFCAEHSAIAAMITHGDAKIMKIVATMQDGTPIPPCGRCRELLFQVHKDNIDTEIIIGKDKKMTLQELLPNRWQDKYFK